MSSNEIKATAPDWSAVQAEAEKRFPVRRGARPRRAADGTRAKGRSPDPNEDRRSDYLLLRVTGTDDESALALSSPTARGGATAPQCGDWARRIRSLERMGADVKVANAALERWEKAAPGQARNVARAALLRAVRTAARRTAKDLLRAPDTGSRRTVPVRQAPETPEDRILRHLDRLPLNWRSPVHATVAFPPSIGETPVRWAEADPAAFCRCRENLELWH